MRSLLVMVVLVPLVGLATPRKVTCSLDGKPWPALTDAIVATTDPVMGKRLGVSLAADADGALPRVEVSLAWSRLEPRKDATITVENPKLGADLQAFLTPGGSAARWTTQKGTAVVKWPAGDAATVSVTLEVTFVQKKGGAAPRVFSCSLEGAPFRSQL